MYIEYISNHLTALLLIICFSFLDTLFVSSSKCNKRTTCGCQRSADMDIFFYYDHQGQGHVKVKVKLAHMYEGLVPRIIVPKYDWNPPRDKKVMGNVKVLAGRQTHESALVLILTLYGVQLCTNGSCKLHLYVHGYVVTVINVGWVVHDQCGVSCPWLLIFRNQCYTCITFQTIYTPCFLTATSCLRPVILIRWALAKLHHNPLMNGRIVDCTQSITNVWSPNATLNLELLVWVWHITHGIDMLNTRYLNPITSSLTRH